MSVRIDALTKRYGDTVALNDLTLEIEPNSFTVFTGPPKSGKSVLFRMLVGLETPESGTVTLDGEDITTTPAARRSLGYVPQSFALYPHMSVFQNIAYPMILAGAPKERIAARVDRAAGMLSITDLLQKTPDQLSGGEKQRTAVARGLLKDAKVFVLDDPLVGLDYKLRERLMDDLKTLREELDATFIYGTADSIEALTMASSIVVLDQGAVVQTGAPEQVYLHPEHVRALELIGFPRANVIRGRLSNGEAVAGPIRMPTDLAGDRPVTLGVRPEAIILAGGDRQGALKGTVRLVEDLGSEVEVYLEVGGEMLIAAFAVGDAPIPRQGEEAAIEIRPESVLIFDAGTGRAIGRCGAKEAA